MNIDIECKPMNAKKAIELLQGNGYKEITITETPEALHVVIIINGGRLRRPSFDVSHEFYMTAPAVLMIEIQRHIRIFGKTIMLWKIGSVFSFHRSRLEAKKRIRN